MSSVVLKRSEVPVEQTWNLESVYPSDEAWEAAFQAAEGMLPELERAREHLGDSAGTLLSWLRLDEKATLEISRIVLYANMQYDTDTADPAASARFQRAMSLAAGLGAARAGSPTAIASLGREKLAEFMEAEPDLRPFAHSFDVLLRLQEHLRSAEVEEVLARAGEPLMTPWLAVTSLTDADLKFGTVTAAGAQNHEVAQGTIGALLESEDRAVRKAAWERFADGHLAVKNTLGSLLAGSVKGSVFNARVRHYVSAREAALFSEAIPVEVYENVTRTFRAHLPIWHRYWRTKRRGLGVDRLHVYDIWAPLAPEPPVSYEQAVRWLIEGMAPLGPEYVEPMRRGLQEERWVDVFPNQGKRGGAYSGGVYGTYPFVLMSWVGGLNDLSTLSHELGHSMHSYFTNAAQPQTYANYSIFAAEVPSNFNQALVRAHLLREQADPRFQIAVIGEAMANFHRYLFIMPILALFEDEIYRRAERGEGLTAVGMSQLMADLFREGYGGEVEIDEERVGITWAQFQHLYMNFYVFQYTTGISAAAALAERVLQGDGSVVPRYLDFLRAGSSLYPLEALKLAGIDMTTPEPLERAFRTLEELVNRLDSLLDQVG